MRRWQKTCAWPLTKYFKAEANMILFTSGFPYSGKTTFAEKLTKNLGNKHVLHINPKDFYLEEFDKLGPEGQTEIAVVAWEMALEKATKSICALPNKVLIIFDTCCSKSLHMRPLFMNAKVAGHEVYMVYVHADLESRSKRTSKDLTAFEDRYKNDFLETLPILKQHTDHWAIVSNNNDENNELMDSTVENITMKIKSTRSE